MFYLHVIAESGIGSKQDLALFVHTVVHAWQLGRQADLVTAPGVCVQQTGTGFGSVGKTHKRKTCCIKKQLHDFKHIFKTSSVDRTQNKSNQITHKNPTSLEILMKMNSD